MIPDKRAGHLLHFPEETNLEQADFCFLLRIEDGPFKTLTIWHPYAERRHGAALAVGKADRINLGSRGVGFGIWVRLVL